MKRFICLLLILPMLLCGCTKKESNHYDNIGFYGEYDMWPVQRGGKWGAIDREGNLIVPCQWTRLRAFSFSVDDITLAYTEDKLAFISQQGKIIGGSPREEDTFTFGIDGEYLFLLEDGVLSIWHADGTQVY